MAVGHLKPKCNRIDQINTLEILIVCLAAFAAGFIDAVVGGGGLVQTPVMLLTFPQAPVATVLGTVKIPSFCGTAVSAYQYSRRISINWRLIIWVAMAAFAAAMAGSYMVTLLTNDLLKPIILVALGAVAVFTYTRQSLGLRHEEIPFRLALQKGMVAGLLIGFYDGFIGPGTGTFLVLVFIAIIGYDFLHASAHAKMVNLATNLASMLYFGTTGHIMYEIALPMAACNMAGGWAGTKMALWRGNQFVRTFFLIVVVATLVRFGYDVFF